MKVLFRRSVFCFYSNNYCDAKTFTGYMNVVYSCIVLTCLPELTSSRHARQLGWLSPRLAGRQVLMLASLLPSVGAPLGCVNESMRALWLDITCHCFQYNEESVNVCKNPPNKLQTQSQPSWNYRETVLVSVRALSLCALHCIDLHLL